MMRPWGPKRSIMQYGSFSASPTPASFSDIVDYLSFGESRPSKPFRNNGGKHGKLPEFFRRATVSPGTRLPDGTKPPSPDDTPGE